MKQKPTPPPNQLIKERLSLPGIIVLVVSGFLLGYSIGYIIFKLITI